MHHLFGFWDCVLALLACQAHLAAAAAVGRAQQPLSDATANGHASYGKHGAVASESAVCSEIGVDLMRQGGTAADAMVGTTLCVGVMGMYHSGIGGGGFMLVRDAAGRYETVDFREAAPAAAHENMFDGNFVGSVIGGLAVAVPGELRGLEYLHSRYGALPWKTVVQPAARVARDGFPVSADLVRYMASAMDMVGTFLLDDPVWAEDFAPNGTLVQLGDTITRKRYAATLETIAEKGVEAFYEGELAEEMVQLIRERNGTMTLEDFRAYQVILRPAISTSFGGRRLTSTPAPSSGAVALSILKTMEQFGLSSGDMAAAGVNLTTHRFDEALRFGYGARTHLGDPAFVDGVAALEADLLTAQRAAANRRAIRDDRTLPVEAYNPVHLGGVPTYAQPRSYGTSHVVAADASGMAISTTTTINTLFGSLVMTPRSGIVLNNEMNDFSMPGADNEFGYPPSPANLIRGGKRPLSSITPLMAECPAAAAAEDDTDSSSGSDMALCLVTGAAGGSRIISATAQVAWHVLQDGLDMAGALAVPRLHDQLLPNCAQFEVGFDKATVAAMVARGHNVTWMSSYLSAVQGIRVLAGGRFEAAGEPRQRMSGGAVF